MVKEGRGSIRSRLIICAAAMGLVLGFAARGETASYTFTKIADTSTVITDKSGNTSTASSLGFPSMNDGGTVVFSAVLNSGVKGIFIGDGTTPTTIVDTTIADPSAGTSPRPLFANFGGHLVINSGGVVAFKAFLGVGGSSIFTGDGTTITTIANSSPRTETSPCFTFVGDPSLSDGNTVAFRAFRNGMWGIFTGDGTTDCTQWSADPPIAPATIANARASSSPRFSDFRDDPSINDLGMVAFKAFLALGGSGIFTGDGTTTTTIADNSGAFSAFSPPSCTSPPSINDKGTVAFCASLDSGSSGIFTGDGTSTTTIVDTTSSTFTAFDSPSVNDQGTVAFWARIDTQTNGIFTGADPTMHKVIAVGDPLSGSTVTAVSFAREGLNGAGQVTFVATLADGTQGVYRADPEAPPDPEAAADPVPTQAQVSIDIKPGNSRNTIKLRKRGVLPVAILSTDTFDATTVDPTTVTLASASVQLKRDGTAMVESKDVNGDGLLDLVVRFPTKSFELTETDGQADLGLTGATFDGTRITGVDAVRIVPKSHTPRLHVPRRVRRRKDHDRLRALAKKTTRDFKEFRHDLRKLRKRERKLQRRQRELHRDIRKGASRDEIKEDRQKLRKARHQVRRYRRELHRDRRKIGKDLQKLERHTRNRRRNIRREASRNEIKKDRRQIHKNWRKIRRDVRELRRDWQKLWRHHRKLKQNKQELHRDIRKGASRYKIKKDRREIRHDRRRVRRYVREFAKDLRKLRRDTDKLHRRHIRHRNED